MADDIAHKTRALVALLGQRAAGEAWAALDDVLGAHMAYDVKRRALVAPQAAHSLAQAFVAANMSSDAAARHALDLLLQASTATSETMPCQVKYRRLTNSRLQACCSVPGLDFIYESTAISALHPHFRLRRFAFADSDDEEYYWRPWETTLADAELDYERWKEVDFKSELDVGGDHDVDWAEVVRKAVSETPSEEESSSSDSYSPVELTGGPGQQFESAVAALKIHERPVYYHEDCAVDDDDDYWNRYDQEF